MLGESLCILWWSVVVTTVVGTRGLLNNAAGNINI